MAKYRIMNASGIVRAQFDFLDDFNSTWILEGGGTNNKELVAQEYVKGNWQAYTPAQVPADAQPSAKNTTASAAPAKPANAGEIPASKINPTHSESTPT